MILKYINSENKEFDLKDARFRLKEGNFHNVSWKYSSITKRFGVAVKQFEKDPISFELTFAIKGPISKRKAMLNEIHGAMEVDKLNKIPGKIVWNDSYIEGYFISSSTYPASEGNGTINTTVFFAPVPFWIQEQLISIHPISGVAAVSDKVLTKKYPYTYPYRYPVLQTETTVNVDHYTESDFQMKVYGPATSVHIYIAGHPYIVHYPIEAGEYMVIDSRPVEMDKKLYVVKANGDTVNIFHYRDTENSVFKKIPPGQIKVDYPRSYGVDLTIFKERSEPLWNSLQ